MWLLTCGSNLMLSGTGDDGRRLLERAALLYGS